MCFKGVSWVLIQAIVCCIGVCYGYIHFILKQLAKLQSTCQAAAFVAVMSSKGGAPYCHIYGEGDAFFRMSHCSLPQLLGSQIMLVRTLANVIRMATAEQWRIFTINCHAPADLLFARMISSKLTYGLSKKALIWKSTFFWLKNIF